MSLVRRPVALGATLALAALLAVGCGAGSDGAADGARLSVTSDFGARSVRSLEVADVPAQETVLRALRRDTEVRTGSGGAVRSIGGLAAIGAADWSLWVNGVEATAATRLRPGDDVWWDRRDGAAVRVPAVVGSFPEPFRHGIGGKRLPVRVECAQPEAAACETVATRLSDLGVPAARGGLRTSHVAQTLRVVVAPWAIARTADLALQRMERGPRASGVFARPAPDGSRIALLDERTRQDGVLGPGGGLIVAVRDGQSAPTWAVTGTDEAGVEAAARAFGERALRHRFAVAVDGGRPLALPG